MAIHDTTSGQKINAYSDPEGQRFYASFAPSSNQATDLPPGGLTTLNPIDLIDTTAFAADGTVTVSGSFSRSAPDASTLRFYTVTGEDGGVLDPISGVTLMPGDAGYAAAARNSANLISSSGSTLQSADQAIDSFSFEAQYWLIKSQAPITRCKSITNQFLPITAMDSNTSMVSP